MLCMTALARMCDQRTRATMYSLNGLAGSLAVLLIQYVGGYLYSDKDLREGPLLIALSV